MDADADIQRGVLDTLLHEPLVDGAAIGVGVVDGIVRLTGDVVSEGERQLIERMTKHVAGVKAVANDLKVRSARHRARTDTAIAQMVVQALAWDTLVPHTRIQPTVHNGHVTLEGEVDWSYQKEAAEHAVDSFSGVTGVTNLIKLRAPLVQVHEIGTICARE